MERRMKKFKSMLFSNHQLLANDNPSNILLVCNAGNSNGHVASEVSTFFEKWGRIKSCILLPGKSYSFIQFDSVCNAEKCYKEVHGKISLGPTNPIYLLFVDEIPTCKQSSSNLIKIDKLPPGAVLYKDFFSQAEERKFLDIAEKAYESSSTTLKQRKVHHFGYAFEYGKNTIDKNNPLPHGLPDECSIIKNKLTELGHFLPYELDQLTINHYSPGQGIPPHVDTHSAFEDQILILSLGTDIVMDFKKGNLHLPVILPQRSLLIISGESRYAWTHGIASRKNDLCLINGKEVIIERNSRISFTFRKILQGECNCNYPDNCDSFLKRKMQSNNPEKLEKEFVHEVYQNISEHFSQTRYKPWPKVKDFVQTLPPGSVLIDIGCGNGKYFGQNQTIFEIGGDYCAPLIDICNQRGFEMLRFDCLSLPFKDNVADAIICIAVLHHLSTKERRIHAIEEILRILQKRGKALIYVWAKEQNIKEPSCYIQKNTKKNCENSNNETNQSTVGYKEETSFNEVIGEEISTLPIHKNRTEFNEECQDLFVPWVLKSKKEHEQTFLRYYHVFQENELEELCSSANCFIEKSYYDNGNWCVIITQNGDPV